MTDQEPHPLYKAPSESDLPSLIRRAASGRSSTSVDHGLLPIPPRPTLPLHTMFSDEAIRAASPSPPPSLSPHPVRAPSVMMRPSPSTSPRFEPPATAPAAVSFSEYVTSEFGANNNNPRFRLAFAGQPASSPTPASTSSVAIPDGNTDTAITAAVAGVAAIAMAPNTSADADARIERSSETPITRADSLPNIPVSELLNPSGPPARPGRSNLDVSTPIDPSHETETQNPDPHPVSRAAWGKLDCIELDKLGKVSERSMTRPEIIQEARAAGPNIISSIPNMHAIFSEATHRPNVTDLHAISDMLASPGFPVDSRRGIYKSLRDYLRNSLQIRDIRQVDPAFVAKPALWVRHSAIVVSLEGIRAIILFNKIFLFDPSHEDTSELLDLARKCVLQNPDSDNPQPFEFNALEAILIFAAMRLEKEFENLESQIKVYLHHLPNELTTKMLEKLRRKKQQLSHFHSRAHNVKSILENLLDEDEEMADMYLTEKRNTGNAIRDSHDHTEVETLLETYLQVIDELVNHAALLDDGIDDTEGLVMIHLDTLRNRLLKVELSLGVVTMMSTLGSVISGIFGMNFEVGIFGENSSLVWFWAVVGTIVVIIVIASWAILGRLRSRGLYGID